MSLSNIDKTHSEGILAMINSQNLGHNALEVVRSNYMQYGKLKHIAKQMEMLKREAAEIIRESFQQNDIQGIPCRCKKVSGNTYYLYTKQEGSRYFSLISPDEWGNIFSDEHVGTYYYDYDKTFVKIST